MYVLLLFGPLVDFALPRGSSFTCDLCVHPITKLIKSIACNVCYRVFHLHCCEANIESLTESNSWLCPFCIIDAFPFNHIVDDKVFLSMVTEDSHSRDLSQIMNVDLKLDLFPDVSKQASK